jgi:hypothetical protein
MKLGYLSIMSPVYGGDNNTKGQRFYKTSDTRSPISIARQAEMSKAGKTFDFYGKALL